MITWDEVCGPVRVPTATPEGDHVVNEVEFPLFSFPKVGELASAERLVIAEEMVRTYHLPFIDKILIFNDQSNLKETQDNRPHVVWLTALILACEEVSTHMGYLRQQYQNATQDYESEKTAITTSRQGNWRKKLEQHINKWKNESEPILLQALATAQLELDAYVDLFIRDFVFAPDGIAHLEEALSEILGDLTQNLSTDSHVQLFFQSVHNRLKTLQKSPPEIDADVWRYKTNSALLFPANGSEPLIQIATAAFTDHESPYDSEKNAHDHAAELAQEVIKMLLHYHQELSFETEETPLATLFHDLVLACSLADCYGETIIVFLNWFFKTADSKPKVNLLKELDSQIVTLHKQVLADIRQVMNQFHLLVPSDESLTTSAALLDVTAIETRATNTGSYVGKGYQFVRGLSSLITFLYQSGRADLANKLKYRSSLNKIDFGKTLVRLLSDNARHPNRKEIENMENILAFISEFANDPQGRTSLSTSIRKFLSPVDPNRPLPGAVDELFFAEVPAGARDRNPEVLRSDLDNHSDGQLRSVYITSMLAGLAFGPHFNPEQQKREVVINKRLIRESCWGYTHFLAKCGDSFNSEDNPRLRQFYIDSVTFYPIYGRSGEYQVVVKFLSTVLNTFPNLQHSENQIQFVINRSGELVFGPEPKLTKLYEIPLSTRETIKSVVLPLLNYIVSGAFVNDKNNQGALKNLEPRRDRDLTSVRPHWRKLPPRWGMKTTRALEHYQQCLIDHGVNIVQETNLRRSNGALGPDQSITYVRGYVRSDRDLPNYFSHPDFAEQATN